MYGWFGIYGTTDFPDWCYGENRDLFLVFTYQSLVFTQV